MTSRTVTSLLLGFSMVAASPLAILAQQAAAPQPTGAIPQAADANAQPASALPQANVPQPAENAPAQPQQAVFVVPAGTKIPLSLRSSISTKTAMPGDAVYLTSEFPVIVGARVVIPAGVFIQGYVDGLQRPGKVKGRAQLMMHFVSMVFPNGVVIALPGAVDKIPGKTGAEVKDREGLIQESSTKASDVKTVSETTLTGAGVGGLVGIASGSPGMAVGIGAGAGAAAGVVEMMFKHGNEDIVFPEGSTVVMVMQRPLEVQEQQLAGMGNLTGYDGPAMSPINAAQMPLPKPKTQAQTN
jgi:hypothetical protein